MNKIRVLIVDDSFFMQTAIKTILSNDPILEIAGIAKNGLEAITKIKELKPDVVTIDINMPFLDGIKSIQLIMDECPTPIVVISAYTTDKDSEKTIAALSAGAVDFIGKPDGEVSTNLKQYTWEIIKKIKLAASANVKRLPFQLKKELHKPVVTTQAGNLVVLGISTGGPSTLKQLFSLLKENIDVAIVTIIHITDIYAQKLCEILDDNSNFKVELAAQNSKIERGKILVCSGVNNYEISNDGRISIVAPPANQTYTPSTDVLFISAAKLANKRRVLGIVMTGMGNDGSRGVEVLYDAGGKIAVQDEKSSVIYGMPKNAKATGKYHYEYNINELAELINKFGNNQIK